MALAACVSTGAAPSQPSATHTAPTATADSSPNQTAAAPSEDLTQALRSAAWVGAADSSESWQFGVFGGKTFTLKTTPLTGSAAPNGTFLAVTERTSEGWRIAVADAISGTSSVVAKGLFPKASLVLARVTTTGDAIYVTDAGAGSTGEVDRIDVASGAVTAAVGPRAPGPEVTVFQMSASNVMLQSFCTPQSCVSAVAAADQALLEFDDIFPVGATASKVFAATDAEGTNWVVVDLASGQRTPLADKGALIQRPLSVVVPLQDESFLVDNGAQLVRVLPDASVSVVLSAERYEGWQLSQVALDNRWVVIRPVDRATGPRLTSEQRRSVSVLDLATGAIDADVTTLPLGQ